MLPVFGEVVLSPSGQPHVQSMVAQKLPGDGICPLGPIDMPKPMVSQFGNLPISLVNCPITIDGHNFSGSSSVGDGCKVGGRHGEVCGNILKSGVIRELERYCGRINPSSGDMKTWSPSVVTRRNYLNRRKFPSELGILSWNTNGRLDFRGCRESLLKRWSMKGFVDIGLIQEHFKKAGTPLFDLFGHSWWNLSSGAIGGARGRRSGGCAIFGQPGLEVGKRFPA